MSSKIRLTGGYRKTVSFQIATIIYDGTWWFCDSPESLAVRSVPQEYKKSRSDWTDLTDQDRRTFYARWLEHNEPAVRANAMICLINQANYLLDRQISAVEKQFVEEGGYSEQLAAARLAERKRKNGPSNRSNPSNQIPACPECGVLMVLRTAKTGKNEGKQFWGCSGYPECKGAVNL